MRPFDPRLVRHAGAARGYLILTVCIGFFATALILAQASLLAHVLAGAARGAGVGSLRATIVALLLVLLTRALMAFGGEAAALRAAAIVKSQLRRRLVARSLRLGPAWLTWQQPGEIATLATKGLDALDPYFARYMPQLVLGVLVPLAVLARVAAADWISGLVIAGTLPLIPLFAILVGLHTKARTRRQWHLLAALGGHFLDVVEGLPTLKIFGRGKAQAEIIKKVTDEHRSATMAALRIAFLSALVLELAAALATALVAVEVGLRLLAGHIGYETALLVLLLTPEAYLPLRALGAQFHASAEGTAAADRVFQILDSQQQGSPKLASPRLATARARVDLSEQPIELTSVSLCYPDRDVPALSEVSVTVSPGAHIAVTGPSGAGKSSLLALLLRFAEPTSGRITAGGDSGRFLAPPDRVGAAEPVSVCWHGRREHCARPAGRDSRRHQPGSADGGSRRLHLGARSRLRHPAWRAGACPVGRAATANRARARVPARRAACPTRRADCAPGPEHSHGDHGHDRYADARADSAAGHARLAPPD
jgi:ATP-binding cassette subfamily C protein CydD